MGTALSVSPAVRKDGGSSESGGATVYQSLLGGPGRGSGDRKPLVAKRGPLLLGSLSLKKLQTAVRRRGDGDSRGSSAARRDSGGGTHNKSYSCYTIAESAFEGSGVGFRSGHGVDAGSTTTATTGSAMRKSETFPSSLAGGTGGVGGGSSVGRRMVVQASTSELLHCVGKYLCSKCWKLGELQVSDIVSWLRAADRALIAQGWQEIGFVNPANVVFVYMLLKDLVAEDVDTVAELRGVVHACLYMSYAYMGNEISYPIKPFLSGGGDREKFWAHCLRLVDTMSDKMLEINRDPLLFASLFRELKSVSQVQAEE